MTVRIQLESDWGLPPYYVFDEETGSYEMYDVETFQEELGLPDEAIAAVEAWDADYYAALDFDDPANTPWMTPAQAQRSRELGAEAVRLLRAHLPADAEVVLLPAHIIPGSPR